MVPIYDSDIAETRWAKAEWERYELWEHVEGRERRQRRYWILGTVLVFLCLSSVPIVMDRRPKWRALSAARRLAQEVNQLKKDAIIEHAAYRLRFTDRDSLDFVVEKTGSCAEGGAVPVRSGSLGQGSGLVLLDRSTGEERGIPGLLQGVCYDFLAGSDAILRGESVVGFGILPAKDLTDGRLDRLTVLLLSGPSAELSFD